MSVRLLEPWTAPADLAPDHRDPQKAGSISRGPFSCLLENLHAGKSRSRVTGSRRWRKSLGAGGHWFRSVKETPVCVVAGMYCLKKSICLAVASLKCDPSILKHPKIPMKGPHLGSLGAGIAQCPDDRITTGGNSSPRSRIITEYCGSHKRILEGNLFFFFPSIQQFGV